MHSQEQALSIAGCGPKQRKRKKLKRGRAEKVASTRPIPGHSRARTCLQPHPRGSQEASSLSQRSSHPTASGPSAGTQETGGPLSETTTQPRKTLAVQKSSVGEKGRMRPSPGRLPTASREHSSQRPRCAKPPHATPIKAHSNWKTHQIQIPHLQENAGME